MKNYFSIFLLLFSFVVAYSQVKDDIVLPKGGHGLKDSDLYLNVNFYVTKQQIVSVEKGIRMKYFNNISYYLFATKEYNSSNHIWILPTLYADADTRFDFIQQTALVAPKLKFVTQENKSISRDVCTLQSMDTAEIPILKSKKTQEEDKDDFSFNPQMPWWLTARANVYSGNVKKMKSVLSEHKYAVIKAFPNQKIEYKGQLLSEAKMADLLKENKILFIRFDKNLLYKDYIYAINFVSQVAKNVKEPALYLEIFSELEAFITENDIKIE